MKPTFSYGPLTFLLVPPWVSPLQVWVTKTNSIHSSNWTVNEFTYDKLILSCNIWVYTHSFILSLTLKIYTLSQCSSSLSDFEGAPVSSHVQFSSAGGKVKLRGQETQQGAKLCGGSFSLWGQVWLFLFLRRGKKKRVTSRGDLRATLHIRLEI